MYWFLSLCLFASPLTEIAGTRARLSSSALLGSEAKCVEQCDQPARLIMRLKLLKGLQKRQLWQMVLQYPVLLLVAVAIVSVCAHGARLRPEMMKDWGECGITRENLDLERRGGEWRAFMSETTPLSFIHLSPHLSISLISLQLSFLPSFILASCLAVL